MNESLTALKGVSKERTNVGSFGKWYLYWLPAGQCTHAIILLVNVFLTGVWVSDSKITVGVLELSK